MYKTKHSAYVITHTAYLGTFSNQSNLRVQLLYALEMPNFCMKCILFASLLPVNVLLLH